MDDLVESLSQSFQVTKSENNIYVKHPRFDQHKQRTLKSGDQTVRRKDFLKRQRERRCDFQNHVRGLAIGEWDQEEEDEEMDVVEIVMKPPKKYKDQIMLSEWLVDVPNDFEKDWRMVVCPIGKRNLVVAARGKTSCYSKSGHCCKTFPSALPGGSYQCDSKGAYTILDCIYNDLEKTFYVLDVMCWNNHPVYDSDTEFRFFWLQNKLQEAPNLSTISKDNAYKFVGLQNHACVESGIMSALNEWTPDMVDGLLFYHKETHYTFGVTPLVTWLKVSMLNDILNITPPSTFLDALPENAMCQT